MRRRTDFLAAVRRSQRLHAPWVSPPASPAAYAAYLRRVRRPTHVGYLVCRRDTREIVGGVFRSGYLGYYAFVPHARHGLMREGLALVITEAFRRRLHRLEANIQPDNRRSIRLVRGLGFRREGFSPRAARASSPA